MRRDPSISLMGAVCAVCAVALLGWTASSSVAHAFAPKPAYADTRVEVDASKLEGGGSTMEKSVASLSRNEVREAVAKSLGKHLSVVDEGGQAVVHVELLWRDYETSYYGVRIEVRRDGEAELVAVDECKLCDEEKLAAKVAARVPEVLPFLEQKAEPAVAEPEPEASEPGATPEPRGEPVDSAPTDRLEDDVKPRPLGALGITGIVVGAGGLAGVVYGSVLLSRPTTTRVDGEGERFVVEESYTRPGGIWLGVGLGVTVVGAAMVAVDRTVLRKRRESQSQRLTVRPAVGPALTGATLHIRF